jgi:hypothetical protein
MTRKGQIMMSSSVLSKAKQVEAIEAGDFSAPDLYHPLPNLLEMSAAQILACYRNSQMLDFRTTLNQVRDGAGELSAHIGILGRYLASHPTEGFNRRLHIDTVEHLFRRMHDHVMAHPVWVHPFFVRIAEGNITLEQVKVFARHYFNQVKNTRQCVALALGRFHTMIDRPDGPLNNVLAELTQVVLAGLLSDEFGTAAPQNHGKDRADGAAAVASAVDISQLFSPVTHPALFRRFLDALGGTACDYDVPMLHGVADNVLVQRILSADPAYNELEALASVGLGMEWGVPAFFSMIIAGILKAARREGMTLDPASMEIWSSHVKQDVAHAIAVMIVTSFYVRDTADIRLIEGATNVLMAFRHDMMSDIYREVFGVPCAFLADIDLDPRYFLHDRRIEPLIVAARSRLRLGAVRDYNTYLRKSIGPFMVGG